MEKNNSEGLKKIIEPTVINLQKGKIPPQAVDLEEAVLGAMLIDKKGVDEVIDLLQPEAFYKKAHQFIFESIYNLFHDSSPTPLTFPSNLFVDSFVNVIGNVISFNL